MTRHDCAYWSLAADDVARVPPLPYPHLTQLWLQCFDVQFRDIATFVSEMPQLQVLEVLGHLGRIRLDDAMALTQLPKLREVKLSETSGRWAEQHQPPPQHAAQQLLALQKAAPHIHWVLQAGSVDSWG